MMKWLNRWLCRIYNWIKTKGEVDVNGAEIKIKDWSKSQTFEIWL